MNPKCPIIPVVLYEPDSKMTSGWVSPAYMQALMSHAKFQPLVSLVPQKIVNLKKLNSWESLEQFIKNELLALDPTSISKTSQNLIICLNFGKSISHI